LDITAIKTTNRFYDKWILIFVKNPEQYIETENWIIQKITKFNIYRNGTLFKINTNTLQIKHKDLILLLKEYIEKQHIDNQLTIEDWKNLGVHLNYKNERTRITHSSRTSIGRNQTVFECRPWRYIINID
jgi:hypothetical protein